MNPSRPAALALSALLLATPLLAAPAQKKGGEVGGCSLSHYPVAVGNVNEYRVLTNQLDAERNVVSASENSYTEEVTAVEAGSFKVATTSAGNVSESTWICSDDGLAVKYDEYPETKFSSSGVVVPATIEVGGSWPHSFTMEGPGVNQTTTTVNRVTKREMVSVPAGAFEAWRVDWESETIAKGQEETPSVIRGSLWYATSVGMIKSSVVIAMEMENIRSVETTVELVRHETK